MKKIGKILIIIAGIAIYLNFGWLFGTYCYHNVFYSPPSQHTLLGKAIASGWNTLNKPMPLTQAPNKSMVISMMSVFWPVIFVASMVIWIVYACYYASWFIFAGGIVKLLGIV